MPRRGAAAPVPGAITLAFCVDVLNFGATFLVPVVFGMKHGVAAVAHSMSLVFVAFVCFFAFNARHGEPDTDMKKIIGFLLICVAGTIAVNTKAFDCSTCLGEDTATFKTVANHMAECLTCKQYLKEIWGENSDIFNEKTADGGSTPRHPECYNKNLHVWNPCAEKVAQLSVITKQLTCKK